ncbi:hypothetical protein KR018_000486 [Drosophila ironensis]|nr:hypothetical protein KR018_000486 [Drosophila ironensis]
MERGNEEEPTTSNAMSPKSKKMRPKTYKIKPRKEAVHYNPRQSRRLCRRLVCPDGYEKWELYEKVIGAHSIDWIPNPIIAIVVFPDGSVYPMEDHSDRL